MTAKLKLATSLQSLCLVFLLLASLTNASATSRQQKTDNPETTVETQINDDKPGSKEVSASTTDAIKPSWASELSDNNVPVVINIPPSNGPQMWGIPAIVWAVLIGFVGVIATQWTTWGTKRLDLRNEQKAFLRSKIEEFADHWLKSVAETHTRIQQTYDLVQKMEYRVLTGLGEEMVGIHLNRAAAIATLYFSELEKIAEERLELTNKFQIEIDRLAQEPNTTLYSLHQKLKENPIGKQLDDNGKEALAEVKRIAQQLR